MRILLVVLLFQQLLSNFFAIEVLAPIEEAVFNCLEFAQALRVKAGQVQHLKVFCEEQGTERYCK